MQTKIMNCINCPMGCELTVTVDGEGKFVSVTGNTCLRGAQYAKDEITAPTRMLTSTVRIKNGFLPLLPVVSGGRLPKDKVLACAEALRSVEAVAPVKVGAVVVKDILGLGVDIIASRSMGTK
jgi:CxxC motif-containing protein